MTDEDYIGYALDLLDPDDRAAVAAHLAAHPEAVAQLDRVRAALAPLEADREDDPAPPALAARTVARLAEYLVAQEPREAPVADAPGSPAHRAESIAEQFGPPTAPARSYFSTDQPEPRAVGGRFRADLVVAAGIGLFAVGLVMSFVTRARHASDVLACQNNLLTLHQGVAGYADVHGGRLPQVGTDAYPTAGTFVSALADAGQCPPTFHAVCPAAAPVHEPPREAFARPGQSSTVTYTFPLGHRSPTGVVLGLWRSADPADENDPLPVCADFPAAPAAPGTGPTSPHRAGHNVLFVGGNVRFATTPAVGVDGDDIFRNQRGEVAAGLSRVDSVLGRPGDRP